MFLKTIHLSESTKSTPNIGIEKQQSLLTASWERYESNRKRYGDNTEQ